MAEPLLWTALGALDRPAGGAWVDGLGRVTPVPGGPTLDFALQPAGGPLLTAATQPAGAVRQRMQGRLPVVATSWEWRTLRLATEAYICTLSAGPAARAYVAVQAVVFNLSDDAAQGQFAFTIVPHNPAGPVRRRRPAYRAAAVLVNGRLFAVCLPRPHRWDRPTGPLTGAAPGTHPGGQATYTYYIAPWEEAEFLAFLPLPVVSRQSSVVSRQPSAVASEFRTQNSELRTQNAAPIPYRLLKGRTTAAWTARLATGIQVRLPDERWEEAWAVGVGHLLGLAVGNHDPAVQAALAACGYDPADGPAAAAYAWPGGPGDPLPDDWAGRMTAAARRVRRRDPGAGAALQALFQAAGPTFTWPTPPSLPGRRAYSRTIAHWLLLLRDTLFFAAGDRLVLPLALSLAGAGAAGPLAVTTAPTPWGRLTFQVGRPQPAELHLDLTAAGPPPGGYTLWLPHPVARAELDGAPQAAATPSTLHLPPTARALRVYYAA